MENVITEADDVHVELRKTKERVNTSRENLTSRNAAYLEPIEDCAVDNNEDVNIIGNVTIGDDNNETDINNTELNSEETIKLETSEEKVEDQPKIKIISSVSRIVYSTPSEIKEEKREERERKTSKIKTLIGLRRSKEDSTNEVYVDIYHSGVLVEPGKERVEWRVTLDKDYLRWISDKGTGAARIMTVTSIAASNR